MTHSCWLITSFCRKERRAQVLGAGHGLMQAVGRNAAPRRGEPPTACSFQKKLPWTSHIWSALAGLGLLAHCLFLVGFLAEASFVIKSLFPALIIYHP